MPKREIADRAPLTPLTPQPLNTQPSPDPKRPRLLPSTSIPLDEPFNLASLPTLDDVCLNLDVNIPVVDETLIDPFLLNDPNIPSPASTTLSELPEETDKQLVNDYEAVEQHARPYICKYESCDKAFARKSDLARHFRIHTNERGCGKSFIQRSALTVHHRVHTGERPHTCEICLKAFADSSSLARHRRIHTGSKPYACGVDDCDRAFARRNSYLKHYQREHPDEETPTAAIPRAAPLPPPFTPYNAPLGRGRKGFWSDRSPSAPHGFAASHPSEGAAYVEDGFGGYRLAGGGKYDVARVGGGLTTNKPYRFPARGSAPKKGRAVGKRAVSAIAAPASKAPESLQQTQRDASPHPSLASDNSDDDSDHEQDEQQSYEPEQPGTPLLTVPITSTTATFSESGSTGGLAIGSGLFTSGAPSLHSSRSDGFGPGQVLEVGHGQQLGAYGANLSPTDQIPRQAPASVMFEREEGGLNRSVSSPALLRSPPAHIPWVGGGFSAAQVTIPPGHGSQGEPFYPPLPPTAGNTPLHTAVPSPTEDRLNERRLTDPIVPSFSFQAPGGQAMMVPMSEIQTNDFSMLNTPISTEQPQTAPPTLTRFNSAPSVPTRSSVNVNEWLSTSTGPAFENPRFPVLPSVSATLSAIADQSPISSMPTDAPGTAPLPPSATLPTFTPVPLSASPTTDTNGHWGAPIAYPAPPRVNTMPPPPLYNHGPPTPALTSGATVSSIYPQQNGMAPIHPSELFSQYNGYTPPTPANPHAGWTLAPRHGQTKSPLAYYKPHDQAPYSAHPGLYNGQLSPFTPVTAHSHHSAGYQFPHTPPVHQHFQYPQHMRHEQTITLSTPPRGRTDRQVSAMTGIGLGLANVSFNNRISSFSGPPPLASGSLMTGPPFISQSPVIAQPATRLPLHPMQPPQIQHPPHLSHVQSQSGQGVALAVPGAEELCSDDEASEDEEVDEYVPSTRGRKKGVKKGKKVMKGKGAAAVSRAKGRSI